MNSLEKKLRPTRVPSSGPALPIDSSQTDRTARIFVAEKSVAVNKSVIDSAVRKKLKNKSHSGYHLVDKVTKKPKEIEDLEVFSHKKVVASTGLEELLRSQEQLNQKMDQNRVFTHWFNRDQQFASEMLGFAQKSRPYLT